MKLFAKKIDGLNRKSFKNQEYTVLLNRLLLRNNKVCRYYKKGGLRSVGRARLNTRCVFTGRTRAVYKGFKVSRFILKGMGSLGYLPGIRKCS